MSLKKLFSTPLWEFKLDEVDTINENLLKITSDYKPGVDYFKSINPDILILKNKIKDAVQTGLDELGWGGSISSINGMQNPIQPGGNDTPHHHPNYQIVGVYYVSVPKNSGDILFHDPRGSVIWFDPETTSDSFFKGVRPFHRVTPAAGMLLLFPGYLIHSVESNLSDELRLSIAINVTVN